MSTFGPGSAGASSQPSDAAAPPASRVSLQRLEIGVQSVGFRGYGSRTKILGCQPLPLDLGCGVGFGVGGSGSRVQSLGLRVWG